VPFTKEEVEQLMSHLKFKDNTSDSISELELYSNAHLYRINPDERLPIY
jgi:proline dehydrogenase